MLRRHLLPIAVVSASLGGCGSRAPSVEERDYLRYVLPDSLIEMAHLEVASQESIKMVNDEATRYLGLRVFPGQRKVNRGMRAELSVNYPFQPGDTIRYSWRFMLPEDFVSDAPRNRWCLIGQWHDQPNAARGEDWDNFESRSPPVMIGLGELNGSLAIGLTYGPTHGDHKQQTVGPAFLERGKWHRISTEIRWSEGSEGEARVYLDDQAEPVMSAIGPNMNNDYQHYLKLGIYRHPEIATDNWIFIDDVQIASSDVANHE